MKKGISLILVLCFLLSPSFAVASGVVDEDDATSDKCSGAVVLVGGAREFGLLVIGIVWESVRIVLPKSCPAKEKDIDEILSTIE
jgi:hypothetical protein